MCVFAKLIGNKCVFGRVPPGSLRNWQVLVKGFVRTSALTPRTHKPGTMLWVFAKLITVECESGNCRSLVFMLLHILAFESSWIRVETRKALAELLVWDV